MQNCIQPVKNTLSKLFLNCSMTLSNQTTWTAYNQWKILGDFWKRSSFHRINCHYIISEQILGLQLQSLSILHFWKIVSYKADLQATITAIKTPTKPTKQGKSITICFGSCFGSLAFTVISVHSFLMCIFFGCPSSNSCWESIIFEHDIWPHPFLITGVL